ncbi:MAG: FecR domain-containing protein [Luteolibacter sp.]
MKNDHFEDLDILIERLRDGDLDDDEKVSLASRLKSDPAAQDRFARQMMLSAALSQQVSSAPENVVPLFLGKPRRAIVFGRLVSGIAAMIILGVGVCVGMVAKGQRQKAVATLVSVEDASWQSSLPTELGSKLGPGVLNLTSGIATIRFRSGAKVTLEGPAKLELMTPMRARLSSGTAMVRVPKSAIGFVVDTPDGYVIDHGTQFAVHVDELGGNSSFEVITGAISVYLNSTGEEAHLANQWQGVMISDGVLSMFDASKESSVFTPEPKQIRLGTKGRATSVIANNRRRAIDPDVLTAKRSNKGLWDQHSLLGFDLAGLDLSRVSAVRLRLNQVPAARGSATRLPLINRFGIYGLTDESKGNWKIEETWENAPGPKDGRLLGNFEIPRSRSSGSYVVDDARLLEYLRQHAGQNVTLILVRETGPISTGAPGISHSFANDSHPMAAGPQLEFTLKRP